MATNNSDDFTNPISVNTGGTGVASLTAYGPLIGGTTSTGPLAQGVLGVSGTVMRSQGSGQVPIFSPYSSTFVELSTITASGVGSASFNNTFVTSTYNKYFATFKGVTITNSASQLLLQFSTDNGSTNVSPIKSCILQNNYNSATIANTNSSSTFSQLLVTSTATTTINGYVFINIPTSNKMFLTGKAFLNQATGAVSRFSANATSTTTINFLRFTNEAGVFSGVFTLYGIKS